MQEIKIYLSGFIKAALKGCNEKEPLYRESSLVNFMCELGVKQVNDTKK